MAAQLDQVSQALDRCQVELHRSEERFRLLIQTLSDLICVADADGVVQYVTPSADPILGYQPEDLVNAGMGWLEPASLTRLQHLLRTTAPGAQASVELQARHRDGSLRRLDATIRNHLDRPSVAAFVITARDMTEQKRLEEELLDQSLVDPLTGLPTPRLLMVRLAHALARADRHEETVAVMMVELDGLDADQSETGSAATGELLAAVGQRLALCLRASDTLARFDSSRFLVLLDEIDGPASAVSVAGRLINAVAQPIIARGGGVSVTPSIGIAVSTPGHDPRELVREALEALGHAKEAGPARAAVYDPSQRDNRLPPLSR